METRGQRTIAEVASSLGVSEHASIVLIEDGTLYRDEQLALLRAAVAFIHDTDMANRVLWVNLDGSMEFEDELSLSSLSARRLQTSR